jgi:hypothetical protein
VATVRYAVGTPFSALLPWRRFHIDTAWSPADVERELGFLLDGKQGQNGNVEWGGSRWGSGFRLTRRASAGSRWTAVSAFGRVHAMPTGSRVLLRMRLPLATTVLLGIGVPILTLLSVAVSAAALVRNEGIVLLVWTVPLVLWPGLVRPFVSETNAASAFLREFFPPPNPPSAGPFR